MSITGYLNQMTVSYCGGASLVQNRQEALWETNSFLQLLSFTQLKSFRTSNLSFGHKYYLALGQFFVSITSNYHLLNSSLLMKILICKNQILNLIFVVRCRGTTKWVHQACIQRWIDEKQKGNSTQQVNNLISYFVNYFS